MPPDRGEGVLMEDKGLTVSLHDRLVAGERLRGTRVLLDEILAPPAADGVFRFRTESV